MIGNIPKRLAKALIVVTVGAGAFGVSACSSPTPVVGVVVNTYFEGGDSPVWTASVRTADGTIAIVTSTDETLLNVKVRSGGCVRILRGGEDGGNVRNASNVEVVDSSQCAGIR